MFFPLNAELIKTHLSKSMLHSHVCVCVRVRTCVCVQVCVVYTDTYILEVNNN